MKICPKCGKKKSKECFASNRNRKGGLSGWCKECHKNNFIQKKHVYDIRKKEYQREIYYADVGITRQKGREKQARSQQRKRERVGSKQCQRCGEIKNIFQFARRRIAGGDGFKDHCNQCCQKRRVELWHERIQAEPIPKTKTCSKCHEEKLLRYFPKSKEGKFGYTAKCRACLWQEEKQRRVDNREKYSAACKRYRDNNPEKMREYLRRYAEKYPEKVKATKRACRHRRKARIRSNPGSFTGKQIREMFFKQKGKCAICKKSITKGYHIDHVNPVSKGGSNDISNIQLSCGPCNLLKRDQDPIKFMQKQGYLL